MRLWIAPSQMSEEYVRICAAWANDDTYSLILEGKKAPAMALIYITRKHLHGPHKNLVDFAGFLKWLEAEEGKFQLHFHIRRAIQRGKSYGMDRIRMEQLLLEELERVYRD